MMRLTYVVFALLGLFWGSNFIYMKWAAELTTPAQITLLRLFFGFLPLAFVAWRKGVIHRDQVRCLPHFLVMAVLATAFYYFAIAEGTARLPSGIAGVLGGSISLFTTIATLSVPSHGEAQRLDAGWCPCRLCRHRPDCPALGGNG
jgi:drug/metabolite transporter (DMT)-like permease